MPPAAPRVAPPTPQQLARAKARVGRYVLLDTLGRGGFGDVFRGWDPRLSRWVAVKVLHKQSQRARQRFLREIEASARLRHPHIAAVHDAGQDGERVYLVMEWVQGRSLTEAQAGIRPGRAAELVQQIAEAVAYAHRKQIWHRDLKPGNVIVDSSGNARVLDFGLAFLAGDDSQRLSASGMPLGTPAYMPPEQVNGKPNETSDVWGLGALLYFTLTGRGPFDDEPHPMAAVLNRSPAPPRELAPETPRELEAICLRCLQTNSEDRYPNPQAVAEALAGFLRGDAPQNRPAVAVAVAVAVVVLGAVVGGAVALSRSRPVAPAPLASASPADDPSPSVSPLPPPPTTDELLAQAAAESKRRAPFQTVADLLSRARDGAANEAELERIHLAWAALELRRGQMQEALGRLTRRRWDREAPGAARLEAEIRFQLDPSDPQVARSIDVLVAGPPGTARDTAQALLAFQSGEIPRALQLIRQAAEAAPDDPSPHLLLGRSLVMLGDLEGARTAAERAVALSPDDHRGYTILRDLWARRGDVEASLEAGDQVLALLEDHAQAVHYLLRSQTLLRLGRNREARRDIDRAVELDPEHPFPLMQRCAFFLSSGKPGEARRDLLAALALDERAVRGQIASMPSGMREGFERLLER